LRIDRALTVQAQRRRPAFARNEDGAVAVIVALLLVVLLGFVALGVDTASLYRARAQLQSVSDLTAMSAAALPAEATTRAGNAMTRNDTTADQLSQLETGRFLRNPAIAREARFTPLPTGAKGVNAVRVVLTEESPLHFAKIFTEDSHVSLTRAATATRTGAASFALDSHILSLSGANLNNALVGEFGADAALGQGDAEVLAQAEIDLGGLMTALRNEIGDTSLNPADILDRTVDVAQVVRALQSTLPPAVADRLQALEGAAGSNEIAVAALVGGIDTALGLTATGFLTQIDVTALDIVRAVAGADPEGGITLSADIAVPGVLSATTSIRAAEPAAQSGRIALGEEGVQLHRAATRLKTDISVAPAPLGPLGTGVQVASMNLPLYVEVAGATATLDALSCDTSDPANAAARFGTTATPLHPANGTSLAALYLGNLPAGADTNAAVDPAGLDFADLLDISVVIDLPLLPDVVIPGIVIQARSYATVGTSSQQSVTFTHADVAQGNLVKEFGSEQLLGSGVQSLLSPDNLELRVKPGQQGLIGGLAAPVIADLMQSLPATLAAGLVAPVDGVLDGALASAGIRLGAGELTLKNHHCELIRLVR